MKERLRVGIGMFILSEAVFFLMLIASFVYFRAGLNATPGALVPMSQTSIAKPSLYLDPWRTGFFSIFLLASSATMVKAERSAWNRRRNHLRGWLAATIALGATFLVGQVTEYLDLLHRNLTISRDLFGTTFYTVTGFHGFHVFGGLVLLSVLLGLTWHGIPEEPRPVGVDTVAFYWHFVDGVWIVIFALVYLV